MMGARGVTFVAETAGKSPAKRGFLALPGSWVGWLADAIVILAVASLFARRLVGGVRGTIALLIVAGAAALAAFVWKTERSILVWIPLVVGGFWAFWAAASYLIP